jgi:m7GpppX diphosphatase
MMVNETPALYKSIVEPYIAAFPAKRTQWSVRWSFAGPCLIDQSSRVDNILSGVSEADKVLYSDPDEEHGFMIIPDMKWDLSTVSTLYLVALSRGPALRSMRDLRKEHIGLLNRIKEEGGRVVKEKWGLESGLLRFFVHYQPSYCQGFTWGIIHSLIYLTDRFHVHVVNANHVGWMGATVGQAWLLDDIVSLVNLFFYLVVLSLKGYDSSRLTQTMVLRSWNAGRSRTVWGLNMDYMRLCRSKLSNSMLCCPRLCVR